MDARTADTDRMDSRFSVSRVPFSRSYWFSMFSNVEPGNADFLEICVSLDDVIQCNALSDSEDCLQRVSLLDELVLLPALAFPVC